MCMASSDLMRAVNSAEQVLDTAFQDMAVILNNTLGQTDFVARDGFEVYANATFDDLKRNFGRLLRAGQVSWAG